MKNHIFKLPSGVEAEVTEMMAKHQRILTEQSNNLGENLNDILLDVLVRLGGKKVITPEDVKNLLAPDRQQILTEVRKFTMEFDPIFQFNIDYIDENNKKQHYLIEHNFDTQGGFPVDTVKQYNEKGEVVEANFKEYSDVINNKVISITLPKSGKKVQWTMLDGVGESIGIKTKKAHRSSHTPIKMRRPVELYMTDKSKKPTPIQLNLDELSIKDIEYLRKSIYEIEGRVGTEVAYKHPITDEDTYIDVLGVVAFFFPSEHL